MMWSIWSAALLLFVGHLEAVENTEYNLKVVTVASNATDGFLRFMRSAEIYGYQVEVLGMNHPWKGGDMNGAGGGYKINLLKTFMDKYKEDPKTIFLVTDSYDVILTSPASSLLKLFLERKYRVLFSAEPFCWPNRELANHYPPVQSSSKYLNSGGFIGSGKHIHEMLTIGGTVDDLEDDQLFYTKLYLDPDQRNDLGLHLDTQNEFFQALFGLEHTVKIRFRDGAAYVLNVEHNTEPAVIHGNGLSKDTMNQMGNYLAKSWTQTDGCLACRENLIDLGKQTELPKIVMGLFVEKPTPFLSLWLERILHLDYPKDRIHVFLHNNEKYHVKDVDSFVKQVKDYASLTIKGPEDGLTEAEARTAGIKECQAQKCDYYLSVDSEAMLTNVNSIRSLIAQNRTILSPVMIRPGKMWSNFWGALSDEGYYARSEDYGEILDYTKQGIWNVPFISIAYLIRADALKTLPQFPETNTGRDVDMVWCASLRNQGRFMYVTNVDYYGHLVNSDNFDTKLARPEFYQMADNKIDWESRYIHRDYSALLAMDAEIEQPCPDVYWFPVATEKFTDDMIAIMENFGQWSNGNNEDKRLQGGYENVPTRDIHMNQVGLERQWLLFLKDYIRPMQEKLYTGYFHDPPHSLMNFVVRYKPDEQPSLRPHHDSSTYTINLALNRPKVDFEGGGCRFIRYNCSVTDTRVGWTLIHPGRLTHFHEGLPVTKGTRYIMISFVDP